MKCNFCYDGLSYPNRNDLFLTKNSKVSMASLPTNALVDSLSIVASTPAKKKPFVLDGASFNKAKAAVERSFTEDLEVLDSDDDEMKDDLRSEPSPEVAAKDTLENTSSLDESEAKANAKDLLMYSIARNRPVRSSSIQSQKQISDYFRRK